MYADFNKKTIDKAKQEGKKEGKDLSTEALKLLRRLSKMTRQPNINLHISCSKTNLNLKPRKVHIFTV
jgi:hypothetical protein